MSPCKRVYMGEESHHVNSIYMEELGFHHVNMFRLIYMGVLQTRHVDRIYMVLFCMHTFFHTYTYIHAYIHIDIDIHAYNYTYSHPHILGSVLQDANGFLIDPACSPVFKMV